MSNNNKATVTNRQPRAEHRQSIGKASQTKAKAKAEAEAEVGERFERESDMAHGLVNSR